MSTPEIWVREGLDLTLEPDRHGDTVSLRLTDDGREVTIRYTLTLEDLRSLRRWLNKVLK